MLELGLGLTTDQPAGQMGGQDEPRVFTSDQPAGQMGGQDEPRVFTSDQPAAQMRARSEAGACVVKSGCVRGQKRVRAW